MIARREKGEGNAALDADDTGAAVERALDSLRKDALALREAALAVPVRAKRLGKLKWMRRKAQARGVVHRLAAAAFVGVVGAFVVCSALAMMLYGMASGVSAWWGCPLWAGAGVSGLVVLAAAAAAGQLLWTRYAAAVRRKTEEQMPPSPARPI